MRCKPTASLLYRVAYSALARNGCVLEQLIGREGKYKQMPPCLSISHTLAG